MIKPLSKWQPDSNVRFIWDAKTSLNIALSAVYYSKSFDETIDFCNKTKMDTDTYCAIAGPIGEYLWAIDKDNLDTAMLVIKKEVEAYSLLKTLCLI